MMEISAHELLEQMQGDSPPLIVDVRSGFEYASGHLPGALHLPFWQIPMRAAGKISDKKASLVLYCQHGPRAVLAGFLLKRLGYQKVALLKGHMSRWCHERRVVER